MSARSAVQPVKPADPLQPTRCLYLARVRDLPADRHAPVDVIARDAHEEALHTGLLTLFSQVGPVEQVLLPSGRTFAFVLFHELEDAIRAQATMSNCDLLPCPVPVPLPHPRLFIKFADLTQFSNQPPAVLPPPPHPALPAPSDTMDCDTSRTDPVRDGWGEQDERRSG
jgi:hypothetical protein